MEKKAFKELKINESLNRNFRNISLKLDGTMLTFTDGELISTRDCIRNSRFPHIVNLLKKFSINNVVGEMFIENGNIFDINARINWHKAKYMIFDIKSSQSIEQKREYIKEIVDKINNTFITKPMYFATIKEGWDYVIKNNQEGLVAKNSNFDIYKIKKLIEAKVRIVGLETGLQKGAFILENGGKVSATSQAFVERYRQLSKGNEVLAEIEYPFVTSEGKFFQPRLRNVIKR